MMDGMRRFGWCAIVVCVGGMAACADARDLNSDVPTDSSLEASLDVTEARPPAHPPECSERPNSGVSVAGVTATVGPLSLNDNTPTTYVGPDVQGHGYTIYNETGTPQTLDLGIAMLFITTADGEVISGPAGVEAIGVAVEIPANGEAVAPFVWNPIDCRTELAIEPGTYRAVLDVGTPGTISVDELVVTP